MPTQLISDADNVAGSAAEAELIRLATQFPNAFRFDPPDEVAAERLADHLRPDVVREHYLAASEAADARGAERRRKPLRALARAYLRFGAAEQEADLDRLRARQSRPAAGFETLLTRENDPVQRRVELHRWLALEDELAPLRAERNEAREEAVRRVGAPSVASFLGAAHPRPPKGEIEPYERGAIAPLDDLVQRAARRRRGRAGFVDTDPADVRALQRLAAAPGDRLADPSMRRFLRGLAVESGAAEPAWIEKLDDRPWSSHVLARDGATYVTLGCLGGPAGLCSALAEFGRALRAGFVASVRGTAAVRFADPAFDWCGATLFRRLALCSSFRRACGFGEHGSTVEELWFQEAVEPRLSWSYLQAVEEAAGSADLVFERAIERATGEPAIPAQHAEIMDRDPRGAAQLRGTVLGLLMEERLCTRFGRGWNSSARAMRWLHDAWEAEPDHTAEEMAAALDVGTIEPTPIRDACRPLEPA